MFKVNAETLQQYFAADTARQGELKALDALIRRCAPGLKRWFYAGVQPGEAGMRFKMIGYGMTVYRGPKGATGRWPVIGVALQKNYISVYVADAGAALIDQYKDRLKATRIGQGNFSFVTLNQLDRAALSELLGAIQAQVAQTGASDQ